MFSINVTLKWRKRRYIGVFVISGFVISGLCAIQITVILPGPKSVPRYNRDFVISGFVIPGIHCSWLVNPRRVQYPPPPPKKKNSCSCAFTRREINLKIGCGSEFLPVRSHAVAHPLGNVSHKNETE